MNKQYSGSETSDYSVHRVRFTISKKKVSTPLILSLSHEQI